MAGNPSILKMRFPFMDELHHFSRWLKPPTSIISLLRRSARPEGMSFLLMWWLQRCAAGMLFWCYANSCSLDFIRTTWMLVRVEKRGWTNLTLANRCVTSTHISKLSCRRSKKGVVSPQRNTISFILNWPKQYKMMVLNLMNARNPGFLAAGWEKDMSTVAGRGDLRFLCFS